MRMRTLILALLLAGCSSDNGPSPQPQPPPSATGWAASFSKGIVACDDFNFGELHYCTKAQPAKAGQTITMKWTISGTGTLHNVGQGDIDPPTLRLFLWRAGDNMSCAGQMQQYRWWGVETKTDLVIGTQQATSTKLDPALWTDCYGKSGADNPALFQAAIDNAQGLGFTMGGQYFAGHGVAANGQVHFHVDSFQIQ